MVLAAAGLIAADVATYTSLSSFLISRTDDSLDAAHVAAEGALHRGGPGGGPDHDGPDAGSLTAAVRGVYVQVRRPDGSVVVTGAAPQFSGAQEAPPPRLPRSIALTHRQGLDRVVYFTTPATSGGDRYRVRASSEPGSNGLIL